MEAPWVWGGSWPHIPSPLPPLPAGDLGQRHLSAWSLLCSVQNGDNNTGISTCELIWSVKTIIKLTFVIDEYSAGIVEIQEMLVPFPSCAFIHYRPWLVFEKK